jgi:hypothetical protein
MTRAADSTGRAGRALTTRLAPGCRGSCACRPGLGQRAAALGISGILYSPASHDGVSVGSGPMTT